jgi:hypothetical protein
VKIAGNDKNGKIYQIYMKKYWRYKILDFLNRTHFLLFKVDQFLQRRPI